MTATQPTILIVDDDQGLNRLIGRALKRRDFSFISAFTGAEALDLLALDSPNLLLLDLKLPDIGTSELLDRIAALAKPVPFIVITGQGDERVAVEMMKRGALDYLVKDAQFLELVPIVVERALFQLDRDTRLAATEAALRHEHAFSMAVLKTAGALMVVANAEGRILSVNPACERLLGCQAEDLLSSDFGKVFLADTPSRDIQQKIRKLACSSQPYEQEAMVVTRGGERRLVAWTLTAQMEDYIIASGMDITERRRLEQEILEVSDREQKRIGQDLHDGLCQVLAGINMLAVALKKDLVSKNRAEAADADTIASYANNAVMQARLVSRGLSPVELETHGLMAALEELAASTEKLFQVKCEFVCPGSVLISDNAKATHLYRIAQEAIGNAVKHSGAKTIRLALSNSNKRSALMIDDDGRGLTENSDMLMRERKGMGFRTMNYRASIIGANLTVQPRRPHGTTVVCSFPAEEV